MEHRIDRLSAADALRALYIDFEGNKDQPPVLLGVHRRGRGDRPYVQQDVVDPLFAGLVTRYIPLVDAIENVVRRAEHGDRRIVAWTEHELMVVRRDCASRPDVIARFTARYVNAYSVAKYWRNKLHGGAKPESGTLYAWLSLIGHEVPREAEAGHVGATLTAVRDRLARGLLLTPGQEAGWSRLVEH